MLIPAPEKVLVARQPIYNQKMGVYAYELLFRSATQTLAELGEDLATQQVLLNAFLLMGIDDLVGARFAAINISERYLYQADTMPVPAARVILDIPATLSVTTETLNQFVRLRAMGFTLALDGFRFRPEIVPLLHHTDILKLDVRQLNLKTLANDLRQYRRFPGLRLLALKVESLDEYAYFRDLGFDYCQGNLLSKPRVYEADRLPNNKLSILNLLAELYKPSADFTAVERVVSRDVSISYKLLRLINSAYFSLPRKVESIQHAVVMLGEEKLRNWISLLALSAADDCPVALLEIAMTRGKLCELMAQCAHMPQKEGYFTVGLLSALDVVMQRPLDKLIGDLPLSDAIKDAILKHQGSMGRALACALAYEDADWAGVSFESVPADEISAAAMSAHQWGRDLLGAL